MSQTAVFIKENATGPGLGNKLCELEYAHEELPLMDLQACREQAHFWKKMHAEVLGFYHPSR